MFMRICLWLSLIVILCNQQLCAQKDTVILKKERHQHFLPKIILPSVFILSGVLLTGKQIEKDWQVAVRNKVGYDYHTNMEDYIQYVPYVEIYLGDLAGIKAKNHWFDQTKNIFIGGLFTTLITHSLKIGVGKERPDGSSKRSFSSGHTATSFLGATILYHEFKDSSPLLAYSGYAFSTSTGGLRVINNRHWVSDVIAGAGVGILVANLVYYIEPLKNWNPFRTNNNLTFSPIINGDEFTFVAVLTF